jgi:hypothetical protein
MTEKGAMLLNKSTKLITSEEKIQNSQSKNTKIEDFFGLSGKKRQREQDIEELKESERNSIFL